MTVESSCHSPRLTRRLRRLAILALPLLLAPVAGSAHAQTDHDEVIQESKRQIADREAERESLREVADDATENLNIAQGTADDLIAALDAVRASVEAQQSAHDQARWAVAAAEAVVRDAEARIVALEDDLAAAQAGLRDAVIESYVTFQSPAGSLSVLGADPWKNARDEALAGFATGSRLDSLDELRQLGSELERWRIIAAENTGQAQARQAQAETLLDELKAAQAAEAELVVAAEERLELRLYEVQSLQALDASLAAEIAREERRIADALARKRADEEALRRAREEAARRAEAERQAAQAESLTPDDAGFTLVWVRGFYVNSTIADETRGLIDAMAAAGFELGGGAYRSHASQISLRRAHCGTSDYAVWQMPASRCRPPTARPGRSNHEKGLAIDFTYNGRIISSRSSAVFQALRRIAPQYGFKNLPSEPWHWSVDGR